ncbi:formylglycine-generating enzyme family protein [Herpetosiphon giganteus]|uniref:formylglycine-generating enzyme family protein n=1 Tax=Herpetosiphon giganteus TaxID=2029754 RepID=UPI00195B4E72|nr:SUMF1/EgtB/PvdO family nonheme iron enzyme [Herpetosiphon giganteus]MBM7844658.1 formylglycine-generating enzyme required for sulfatase activity [Herpetosiphon giganteus]
MDDRLPGLIDQHDSMHKRPKPLSTWYRDLMLAAQLGAEEHWAGPDGQSIKQTIVQGIAQLLDDRDHAQTALAYRQGHTIEPTPLLVEQRQTATELLAALGDARYPVSIEQWQQATSDLTKQFGREGGHYWRYVPAARYQVGGWEVGQTPTSVELQPYWVGRLMITVEQYRRFMQAGGYAKAECWSSAGWAWKETYQRAEPEWWESQTHPEAANQPVYGVSWYEVLAYCNWLTQQLAPVLPQGYEVCLASEAEWEVAAAYPAQGQRQRSPWGDQPATPEHAVYAWSEAQRPLAVGLGLLGQAGCGALDYVGNLWEYTSTIYQAAIEHDQSAPGFVVCGGSYYGTSADMLCAARYWTTPVVSSDSRGFRCTLARRGSNEGHSRRNDKRAGNEFQN